MWVFGLDCVFVWDGGCLTADKVVWGFFGVFSRLIYDSLELSNDYDYKWVMENIILID